LDELVQLIFKQLRICYHSLPSCPLGI
jgi:hypothetical protein